MTGTSYNGTLPLAAATTGVDGLEATRQIRTAEEKTGRHRTPIVALTANVTPEDRARCLAAGMDDFVCKPATKDTLHRALARWCGNPASLTDGRPADVEPHAGDLSRA